MGFIWNDGDALELDTNVAIGEDELPVSSPRSLLRHELFDENSESLSWGVPFPLLLYTPISCI